mgnify:CR=1 FL=1
MNARQKGKRGELELAHLLQTYGYPAERGVQYSGLKGNADVVGVEGLHIECKRSERVTEEDFIKQAERDARKGQIPIVMYRKNGEQWKALLRLDTFMAIWVELTEEQKATIKDKVKLLRRAEK